MTDLQTACTTHGQEIVLDVKFPDLQGRVGQLFSSSTEGQKQYPDE